MDSNKFASSKTSNERPRMNTDPKKDQFPNGHSFCHEIQPLHTAIPVCPDQPCSLEHQSLVLFGAGSPLAHATTTGANTEQKSKTSALITIVRESTERFKNVHVAEKGGYVLQFGCATGSGHRPNRGKRLIGADFVVTAEARDRKKQYPPEPIAQLVRYLGFPNRFDLPAFYTLHVCAGKDNPHDACRNEAEQPPR